MRSAVVWVLVALNIGMGGDILLKKGGWVGLIAGSALFTLTAYPTWKAYQGASFSSVTILWQSAYLIEGLALGVLVFGDTVNLRKCIAVVLALAAILLAGE